MTILRHCRCGDCRRWDSRLGRPELGYRPYKRREELPEAMRSFWSELGMIRPEEWHWCAFYDGPQLSRDVWLWRKSAPKEGVEHGNVNSSGSS